MTVLLKHLPELVARRAAAAGPADTEGRRRKVAELRAAWLASPAGQGQCEWHDWLGLVLACPVTAEDADSVEWWAADKRFASVKRMIGG